MNVEGKDVIDKLSAYLNHNISLPDLVDWAETAMMEGEFIGEDWETVRDIVARIGLADVREFGLNWEDCGEALSELGYRTEVRILDASGLN